MAGFLVKQMVGEKLSGVKGQISKATGGDDSSDKAAVGEDPEVIQARLEQEERRAEKHRRMEAERERMRQGIRAKYGLKTQAEIDEELMSGGCDGRVGATKRKTPEELAREGEIDDSFQGQMNQAVDKAKTALNDFTATLKGFLPFGK